MFNEFFAVTLTSIYHIEMDGSANVVAIKIALQGKSPFGVGHQLSGGDMLAIGKKLIVYTPAGGRLSSYQRNPELVNPRWHGDQTSNVVALFKNRQEAFECFNESDRRSYDERWVESTRAVLGEIGEGHPAFYICRSGSMALPELLAA